MTAGRRHSRTAPAQTAPLAASYAVGLAALIAYLVLLCPVPADKDSGEFTLVLATFGVAHPTGYPLYTLLGGVFVHALHAFGASWEWAANAFSALGGAVAVGALHALGARLMAPRLGGRAAAWVAVIPVAAFALNPAWTSETTLAEVNAWQVAWVAIAAVTAWAALQGVASDDAAARRRAWFGWGVVVGAGLAHHATSVFVAGPLSIALLAAAARRGAVRDAAAALAGAVIPLAALGYIAWRAFHPAAVQWPELAASWDSVRAHLTGAQYRTFLGRFAPSPGQQKLLASFIYPWFVPAVLVGAWCALRGDALRRALGAAVLVQAAYCFVYGVPDPSAYFLAPMALGLVLVVVSLAALDGLERVGRVIVIGGFLGVGVACVEGAMVAQGRNHSYAQFELLLRSMWDSIPRQPAFLIWDDDMANRLRIYQTLQGEHRELIIVQPLHLTHPVPRQRFTDTCGFDPLSDLGDLLAHPPTSDADPRARLLGGAIAATINHHSRLPVIEFLPQVPSVRLMKKQVPTTP